MNTRKAFCIQNCDAFLRPEIFYMQSMSLSSSSMPHSSHFVPFYLHHCLASPHVFAARVTGPTNIFNILPKVVLIPEVYYA